MRLPIRTVVFDLYGTLLVYGDMGKAWDAWIDDVRQALLQLGIPLSRDEVRKQCDGFFARPLEHVPGLVPYESRFFTLATSLGAPPDLPWCRDTARATMDDWQREVPMDPQTPIVLQALRAAGISCVLLTNFDYPAHVHRLLDEIGIAEYFERIVISGEVGLKKPDPRIFALALADSDPAEAVFVGDHPDQDVAGALNAGMTAVLLQRGMAGVERRQVDFHQDGGEGAAIGKSDVPRVTVLSRLEGLIPLLTQP